MSTRNCWTPSPPSTRRAAFSWWGPPISMRVGHHLNMTKIATIQDPRALELFQTLLVASAAIPGAFPPVLIDVEANGQPYQEMHVDGGATAQVFVYPVAQHQGKFA